MRTGFIPSLLGMKLGTLEVKGEWSDHYITEFQHYFLWEETRIPRETHDFWQSFD